MGSWARRMVGLLDGMGIVSRVFRNEIDSVDDCGARSEVGSLQLEVEWS